MGSTRIERYIGIGVAVFIVGFVLYLVERNQAFASPDLARALRIILSLAIGILGATIPGFLNVGYKVGGLVIRAGGALALFVITFFGSPQVESLGLGPPDIRVSDIPQIDIRTRAPPDLVDGERLQAQTVVTVPVSIRNVAQPSRSAFLDSASVIIPTKGGGTHELTWRYFVNMHEEAQGLWLAIDRDAQAQSISAGQVLNMEVLFASDERPLTWAEALEFFDEESLDRHSILLRLVIDETVYEKPCVFDQPRWSQEIRQFRERTGLSPGRVTMNCEKERFDVASDSG